MHNKSIMSALFGLSLFWTVQVALAHVSPEESGVPSNESIRKSVDDYQEALKILEKGDEKNAIVCFEKILNTVPEFHPVRLSLSSLYRKNGRILDAKKLLIQGLEIDEENVEFMSQISEILQEETKGSQERESNVVLLATQYKHAMQLIKQDKFEKARDILNNIVQKSPVFHPARLRLAELYMAQSEWIKADMLLIQGLEIDGDNQDFKKLKNKLEISRISWNEKQFEDSKDEVDVSTFNEKKSTPKMSQTHGNTLIKQKVPLSDVEKAAMNYQKALEKYHEGKVDAAIVGLSNVLQKIPTYHRARLKLAKIYGQEGLWNESKQLLQEGLNLDPEQPGFILQLADVLMHQKESQQALSWLNKIPQSQRQKKSYLSILALASYREGLFDLSLNAYKALLTRDRQNSRWWLGLGLVQLELGDKKEAYRSLRNARTLGQLETEVIQFIDVKLDDLSDHAPKQS